MDLGKRKKLVGLSKRDRSNIAARKGTGGESMLTLVQEKLKHLEANYNEKENNNITSPSCVLPNIAEYTQNINTEYSENVKYIRHPVPVTWTIEDIERHNENNSESNGELKYDMHRYRGNKPSSKLRHPLLDNTLQANLHHRQLSEDGLPIEIFGRVKSTVCSVM